MNKFAPLLVMVSLVSPVLAQNARVPRKPKGPAPTGAPAKPAIKGLRPPLGVTDQDLIQAAMRDMPNGVVVVADQAFSFLPDPSARLNFFRIMEPPDTTVSGVPLAPWMDGPVTVSGGNTIAHVFCIGGIHL